VNAADTEVLLTTYDRLSATTGCMLAAAQSGDWNQLVTLERDCAEIVARLSSLETVDPLPVGIRDRKAALIRKVLADDAAIRDITEPQLKRLSRMLDANRSEQRLLRAYGPPHE
jgi:flagellar protein FliT